jgi:hypothetical protein
MKKILKFAILPLFALATLVACEEPTPTPDEPNQDQPTPEEPTPDDPEKEEMFEITVSNVATTSAWLDIKPKDKSMSYYFDLIPEEDYVSSNGNVGAFFEAIIAYYQTMYPSIDITTFLPNLLSMGDDSDSVSGLEPNTTYYAYAVEVNPSNGAAGKNWSVAKFTTLEGGDPAKCTFDFEIRNVFATEVEFSITPSDESIAYWYAVTSVDGYPGDQLLQAEVKELIDQYAAENNMTLEDMMPRLVMRGHVDDTWFELERSTSYYVYAYAMDEQGNAAGPIYKELFTTLDTDISSAAIDMQCRIFDGDELYAYDSEKFANVQGRAVLQCEATPNDAAYYWLMMLAAGDFTDASVYPDDATINAMLEAGGQFNQLVTHYYADWNATATLLGFAADYNMIYGPLTRNLITISKENCAPVSEYLENEASPYSQAMSLAPARVNSVVDTKVKSGAKAGFRANI